MYKNNRNKIILIMTLFYTVSIILSNVNLVFADGIKSNSVKKVNNIIGEKQETKIQKGNQKNLKTGYSDIKVKDNITMQGQKENKFDNKGDSLAQYKKKSGLIKNSLTNKLYERNNNIKEVSNNLSREVLKKFNENKVKKTKEAMKIYSKGKSFLSNLGLSYNKTRNMIMVATSLRMNEKSRVLQADETVDSLEINGETIDLNGHTLEIKGNLEHLDGIINVNKGKLIVHGNYNIKGTAVLNSIQEEDYISIGGNLTASSKNISVLDKGTLELKGDFLFNSINLDSFQCGEKQNTLINGSVIQNIEFENYDYNQKSALGVIKVNNKQGVSLKSTLKAHYFEDFDKVHGDVDVCFINRGHVRLKRDQTINGNLTLRNVDLELEYSWKSRSGPELKVKGDFKFYFSNNCNLRVDGKLIIDNDFTGKRDNGYNGTLRGNYIEVRGNINGYNKSKGEDIGVYGDSGLVIECRGDVILDPSYGLPKGSTLILSGNKVQKVQSGGVGNMVIQDNSQVELSYNKYYFHIDGKFSDLDKIKGKVKLQIEGEVTLTRDCVIKDELSIDSLDRGWMDLNGHTIIFEKDFVSGMPIEINKGSLIVKGNLIGGTRHLLSDPKLEGYIRVDGDYRNWAHITSHGIFFMELKGDLYNSFRIHGASILLSGNKKQKIVNKYFRGMNFNLLIIDRPKEEAFEFIDENNVQEHFPLYEQLIEIGKTHETQGKIEYCNGDGVNDATGNFMDTYKDLSIKLGNLDFEFTRSYNSQNNIKGSLGKGWSFGFEGLITSLGESGRYKQVNLPDGSGVIFNKNEVGDYFSEDSRDKLKENSDGTFILTRPSLDKYGFNKKGHLQYIEDRNGNRVNIIVNETNGNITKIRDLVGREFTFAYNSQGLLTSIKDPLNREIKYGYNNDKLIKVTNASGNVLNYSYDVKGNLTEIKNADGSTIKKIIYQYDTIEKKYKVHQTTDEFGNVFTYKYDLFNRITEVEDKNNRKMIKKYDGNRYLIKEEYPEESPEAGTKRIITYKTDKKGQNKYGDIIKSYTRGKGYTTYERDNNGNVTKLINADYSFKTYVYDSNNNIILETDETGRKTHYIYDSEKINLLKKVQALDEDEKYNGVDDKSRFAITEYVYYTDKEREELGYSYKGLLKKVIDPNGNSKTFVYDKYANVVGEVDEEGNTLTKEYNLLGWKTKEISPSGNITQYFHNKNGDIEKVINPDKGVERSYFDNMGRKTAEINPEQYKAEFDKGQNYTGSGVTQREYYSNGKEKSIKDGEGNITQFFYDIYGNKIKEINPNGSIYLYEYNWDNKVTKVKFKESEQKQEVLLDEYEYITYENIVKNKKYINETEYTILEKRYDYADRLVETIYSKNITEDIRYYRNGKVMSKKDKNDNITHYVYDGLNRVKEEWVPICIEGKETKYSYTKYEYDQVGNKIKELRSKDKIDRYDKAKNYACKNYEYYKNNKLKSTWDSEGRREEFTYDKDGFVNSNVSYTSKDKKITKQITNNFRGEPIEEKQAVSENDFYEQYADNKLSIISKINNIGYQSPSNVGNIEYSSKTPIGKLSASGDVILRTINTYDKNGNIIKKTMPSGHEINYSYDNLNREIKKWQDGENEFDQKTVIVNEATYNWDDKQLVSKDALGNITTNEYNSRGFLEKVIDSNKGVTYKVYDYKGRVKFEVSPANYYNNKTINEMNRTEFIYDNMDNVIAIKQHYKINNTWKEYISKAFMYDNNGNKIKELNADEYEKATGNTIQEKITNGDGIDYLYNLNNQLISIATPEGKSRKLSTTTKYEYDALGRKTKEIDASNTETKYYYDDSDNIVKVSVKEGKNAEEKVIRLITYDLVGNKLTETDGNKNVTTYTYNDLNKVSSITFAGDNTISKNVKSMKYDKDGNLSYETDSSKKEIIYVHDKQGNLKSEIKKYNNENIVTKTKYDVNGNKRFEIDGEGNTAENTYDNLNRLISKKTKVTNIKNKTKDHITKYEYDKNSNLIKEVDWLGNEKINQYDPINRVVKKIDGNGKVIELLDYNNNNLQVKSTNSLGNIKQFFYNKDGKLIKTIDEEGNSTEQSYDDKGNLSSKSDGNGNVTTYRYDEFNRLVGVTNPLGEETEYTYDLNGNRLTQKDGNGNTTTYKYNVANKISKIIYPKGLNGDTEIKGKVENYQYDYHGKVSEKIDRNGNSTKYTYDVNGNLISEVVTDKSNSSNNIQMNYVYNKNNNQISMTDSTGTTTRKYDELGRVISKTTPSVGTMAFDYDITEGVKEGEVAEEGIDPKGNKTIKVTDRVGRLIKVISNDKATEYTYNDNGTRKSLKYPGGTTEEYSYYKNNRLKELKNIRPDGSIIDSYSYEYDKAGNQTKKQDVKGITEYKYDPLNRLKEVKENTQLAKNRITTYEYDKAGNRTSEIVNGVKNIYAYDEDNRLLSIQKIAGENKEEEKTYKYDFNGNQLQEHIIKYEKNVQDKSNSSNTKSIVENNFDLLNRLVTSKSANNDTVKNIYNGEGKRIGKEVNGNLTTYVYEGDKVILELDKEGKVKARNTQGINLISRELGETTAYYMYNGHVDITSLVDETGKELSSYYYDAFGNILEEKGSINNPYRYSEYEYDKETGTYYCMSRMYNPEIARFLSEDTYRGDINDPLSLNVYAYVNNNPVTYRDPDGHIAIGAIFAAAVISGGISVGIKAITKYASTGSPSLSFKEAAGAFASGAIGGAVFAVTAGASSGVVLAGIGASGAAGSAVEQKINKGKVNWTNAAKDGAFAVGTAYLGGKLGKRFNETAVGQRVNNTISKFRTKATEVGRKALIKEKELRYRALDNMKTYGNAISQKMSGGKGNLSFAFEGAGGSSYNITKIPNNTKPANKLITKIKSGVGDGIEGAAEPGSRVYDQTKPKSPSNYPNPDPDFTTPPVRYEPKTIEEVERMRKGRGPTTKATHGDRNIEAHHRGQKSVENGGILDDLEEYTHRRGGNHTRHTEPSELTPAQRAKEIRSYWKKRGSEYILPGEGI